MCHAVPKRREVHIVCDGVTDEKVPLSPSKPKIVQTITGVDFF
jgi:hypothetical protein